MRYYVTFNDDTGGIGIAYHPIRAIQEGKIAVDLGFYFACIGRIRNITDITDISPTTNIPHYFLKYIKTKKILRKMTNSQTGTTTSIKI